MYKNMVGDPLLTFARSNIPTAFVVGWEAQDCPRGLTKISKYSMSKVHDIGGIAFYYYYYYYFWLGGGLGEVWYCCF